MKNLQILGSGCAKCQRLTENVKAAADQIGIPYTIEKVNDIVKIAQSGVLQTPALMVNGALKLYGRVPGVEELKKILSDAKEM